MSIYIKGMEMPKSCPSCPFNSRAWYEESHLCLAKNEQIKVNLNTGFDDNCPLAPVPPHGRLGDLDEIERYKERLVVDADKIKKGIRYVVDTKYIKEAPTVIPANRETAHE